MPTPMRSDQVHISGMAARAARLAKEYHCGYEITAFSYAPMLEDAAAFSRVEAECEEIGSLWLHAPFAELIPCAIDPNVRANAMARFRQTTALAARLGVRRIVVHGGFIPYVYFPEWYVEQSICFWKEFLADAPDDLLLAVENVMEPGPEMLVEIARGVDDPRLGLCLDVGHANTVVSKTPPASAERRSWRAVARRTERHSTCTSTRRSRYGSRWSTRRRARSCRSRYLTKTAMRCSRRTRRAMCCWMRSASQW